MPMTKKEGFEVIRANPVTIKASMQVRGQWVPKDRNYQGKVIPLTFKTEHNDWYIHFIRT